MVGERAFYFWGDLDCLKFAYLFPSLLPFRLKDLKGGLKITEVYETIYHETFG